MKRWARSLLKRGHAISDQTVVESSDSEDVDRISDQTVVESSDSEDVDQISDQISFLDGHPLFDAEFYYQKYPEVKTAGYAALEHYVRWGGKEGRATHALFDGAYYSERYPEVLTHSPTPLHHFVQFGGEARLQPHPLFSTRFYCERFPQVRESELHPLVHYVTVGAAAGLQPHPLFDQAFYTSQIQDRILAEHALSHYLQHFLGDPHPLFSNVEYTRIHWDVAVARVNPLLHYLWWGANQGKSPNKNFNEAYHRKRHGLRPFTAGLEHFVESGLAQGLLPIPQLIPRGIFEEIMSQALEDRPKQSARQMAYLLGVNKHAKVTIAAGPIRRVVDEASLDGEFPLEPERQPEFELISPRILDRVTTDVSIGATLPLRYLAKVPDALVLPGTRLLVSSKGDLLHDTIGDEASSFADHHIPELRLLHRNRGVVCVAAPEVRLPRAISIASDADSNYFHWMLEALPKLSLVNEVRLDSEIPLIVPNGLHKNLREALKICAGGRPILECTRGQAVRVDNLYYAGDLSRILE